MDNIDLTQLEQKVSAMWDGILTNSPFIQEILDGKATKALYAIYMIETYHYTKHNAKNQALVGVMGKDLPGKYLSYCFHHAHEEAGHELMALSDIGSIGFDREAVLASKPLPATETLIAYLYWISATGNPIQRLGYSYWAENVYGYIDPVLKAIQSNLNLTPQNMKFFIAHSDIDAKHADEVNEMLQRFCKSQDDVDAVVAVMENSLLLTARILDDVWKEYQLFQSGESDRYAFCVTTLNLSMRFLSVPARGTDIVQQERPWLIFSKLNYALGDEDTLPEYQLLPQGAGHIVAVAGSGGRIVPLIAKRPKAITCVDILQEQLDLTELRVEAIRQLSFADFMALFGYPEYPIGAAQRKELFSKLNLRQQTQQRLAAFFEQSAWKPIIYLGEFEQMLITVSKLIRFVVGKRLDVLFEFDNLQAQRTFVKSKAFPHKRWTLALALFGNATALNALLYRGDFPKKNRAGSTFSIYRDMFAALFELVLCKDNYFFQMLVLGCLVNARSAMMEADEALYYTIKQNLAYTQVHYAQTDIVSAINQVAEPVDFVSMSDVPSFMPDGLANAFLADIAANLAERATVVSRGHLRVIRPDSHGFNDISAQLSNIFSGERTGLWQIQCYQKQS